MCGGAIALVACSDDHGLDSSGPDGGTMDGTMSDADDGLGPITDGGRGSTGSTGLPCEVEEVLISGCRDCHGDPPRWGAPMALMTWEDTQLPSVTDSTVPVHEMMTLRLNAATDPMPPSRNDEMTDEEKAILSAWLDDGAPAAAAADTCAPDGDAGLPDGGGGTIVPPPLPCEDPYEFLAHDPGNPELGYLVPTGGNGNFYTCFAFAAPFEEGEQGTAWGPVIDDERTIHHWILWESPNSYADGSVFPCGALPDSSSVFLAGWAPGGQNFVMPDNVGLKLRPGSTLLLQVHYWNAAGHQDVRDRSGIALCTGHARTHEAGVVAVGPMNISIPPRTDDHEESYTCPGFLTSLIGTMNILASSPHMHGLGKRYTTEIIRNHGSGMETVELLTSVNPWDFNDQTSYPQAPPVVVNGGDGVRVTCTYDNPGPNTVSWGENTEDEMCFDFLLVYPYPSFFDTFGVPANCTDMAEDGICGSVYGPYICN
jgi:hypothetical protein